MLFDAYANSKLSWSTNQTVNGSAGNASGTNLWTLAGGLGLSGRLPILFVIRPDVASYFRHISASESGSVAKANVQRGFVSLADESWPLLLQSQNEDSYLCWISTSTTAGNIRIMIGNQIVPLALDSFSPTIDVIS
jgi:hypothetical protein